MVIIVEADIKKVHGLYENYIAIKEVNTRMTAKNGRRT